MDRYGVATVDRITLAGAFGSHIDVKLRHDPRPDPGLRARQGRLGRQCRRHRRPHRAAQRLPRARRSRSVVRRIEKIETAIEPAFQEHFVGAMAIPHKTDPFPHLEAALGVTFKRVSGSTEGRGGRERRRSRTAD